MATITIDTTQATYKAFAIEDRSFDGSTPQTIQLNPGNHLLFVSSKSILISFSITDQGTIDYTTQFDSYILGRGTNTLTVRAFPVTFDTNSLTQKTFLVAGAIGDTAIETRSLNLVPGEYGLRVNNAADAIFNFTLQLDGTFTYDPSFDRVSDSNNGFLQGRGTSNLVFQGYTIQINATQLSLDQSFGILGGTPTPNLNPKVIQTITVLPGTFFYQHPYPTDFIFSVTTTGIITCESKYQAAVAIEGRKLTISGFPITIDATEIFGSCSLIASSQIVEGTKSLRLLPSVLDQYALDYLGTGTYCFGLDTNGHIIYPNNFEVSASSGFLSGAGTSTLKISGYPLEIDTRNWRNSSIFLQVGGNRIELLANAPSPQIIRLLQQFGYQPPQPPQIGPVKLVVPATSSTPQTELDLSIDVNGNLIHLAAYPDLTVTKEGRKTRLVFGQPPVPKPLTVRGIIRQASGQPLVGAIVQAFDQELRSETRLGEALTDGQGNYTIAYTSDLFQRPNKQNADLIVRVLSSTGEVLAASDVILGAGAVQEVNLILAAPAIGSEWETITQTIVPLLKGTKPIPNTQNFTDLPPEELQDTDLDRLIKQTSLDREQLRLWIAAVKAMKTNTVLIGSDFPGSIDWLNALQALYPSQPLTEVLEWMLFYGWFRQRQASDADVLLNSATDTLIDLLKQAIGQKQIDDLNRVVESTPQGTFTALDIIRRALRRNAIDRALRPATEGQPPSLGDVLRTIPNPYPC
jgi:hypothetical protein